MCVCACVSMCVSRWWIAWIFVSFFSLISLSLASSPYCSLFPRSSLSLPSPSCSFPSPSLLSDLSCTADLPVCSRSLSILRFLFLHSSVIHLHFLFPPSSWVHVNNKPGWCATQQSKSYLALDLFVSFVLFFGHLFLYSLSWYIFFPHCFCPLLYLATLYSVILM